MYLQRQSKGPLCPFGCSSIDRIRPSAPPAVAEKARRIAGHEQPTAVENTAAATTNLKGPGAGDRVPRPFRNVAAEILNRSTPQSGASTPNFVRTAAEVADSAAILDKEESEPEISDREAGRTGVRRMSSTPIAEVSRTAAEVADSAEALDGDCEEVRTNCSTSNRLLAFHI